MNLIELSNKPLDLPFVSKILRMNKLNVMPVQGFYKDPQAWAEDANWKRTVERYDWGMVLFCSNHSANSHYTVVVKGPFDIDTGEVPGKKVAIPIPWYKEMAKALKVQCRQSHVDIKIPGCLGYHEDDANSADPICDGGYIPSRGIAEKPCAWRDRCIPFQAFCVSIKKAPLDARNGYSAEHIVQLTTKLRDEADAKALPMPVPAAVLAANEQVGVVATAKPSMPIASRSIPAQPKTPPPAGGVALFWEVFNSLKAKLKGRRFLTGREDAQPGDIFVQDRAATGGYISIYCQPVSGRRIALVEIRLKADRVHALFPFPPSHKLLQGTPAAEAQDGKFISMVMNVPRTLSVDKLSTILVQAVTTGVIQLPQGAP